MLNRLALFERLQACIDASRQRGEHLGVLVIRSQRLREFNLLFGYETGDAANDAIHAAIAAALRSGDEIHRIGDADFVVIVPGLRNRQHLALAAAKLVRVLHAPLDARGQEILASVAVGGATSPEDGVDADRLVRHADVACDLALASEDRFALYAAPEFTASFAHGDLQDAIAGNTLELYLQPLLDLRSGAIERAEALSRWNHPRLGAITPDVFIRVAEQTGLIRELTRWSLNVALRHAAFAADAGRPLVVSVNLSVGSLQQRGFVEQIRDLLQLWNVKPEHIVLEVTESGLMDDLQTGARRLRELRDAGFGIAIDDFGTGYSSMTYLKRLPATELKIDKSFVFDMARDARTEKLVGSMIDLSHHLGLDVVAEGVENLVTLDLLRGMGCDFAQGYHIARPMAADALLARHVAGRV